MTTRRARVTTAERVAEFLRRYCGVGFCAKCLAREVEASPAMVQASWLEVLEGSDFERSFRWCGDCQATTAVVHTMMRAA